MDITHETVRHVHDPVYDRTCHVHTSRDVIEGYFGLASYNGDEDNTTHFLWDITFESTVCVSIWDHNIEEWEDGEVEHEWLVGSTSLGMKLLTEVTGWDMEHP